MRGYLYPQQNAWEIDATQIISDYLGTPIEAYDEEGQRVWARELDIYGRTRSEEREAGFIPRSVISTRRWDLLTIISMTTLSKQEHTLIKKLFVRKRGS